MMLQRLPRLTLMALHEFTKHYLFSLLRAAFRLTPMPVATRDRLRQRFLDRHSSLVPSGPRGQTGKTSDRKSVV